MSIKPDQVVYRNPDHFVNLEYYKDAKKFCDITIKVSIIISLLLKYTIFPSRATYIPHKQAFILIRSVSVPNFT